MMDIVGSLGGGGLGGNVREGERFRWARLADSARVAGCERASHARQEKMNASLISNWGLVALKRSNKS